MLLLLGSDRALTRREIADVVSGYPDDPESMRKQLHRDKDVLISQGVPLRMFERDNDWLYEIRRSEYYLPQLGLDWEEQLAIELALAVVRLGGLGPDDALRKLGAEVDPTSIPLVALPTESVLPELTEARRLLATASFRYSGLDRTVDLWGVSFQNGHWYAVGWDEGRGDQRVFRVDRIEGDVTIGPPGAVTVPEDFDPATAVPDQPLLPGDQPATAEVWVDALHAPAVVERLGAEADHDSRADGSVVVRFPVSHRGAFRSWLFGLLDHARVLGPPELRDDVVGWLQAMAGQR